MALQTKSSSHRHKLRPFQQETLDLFAEYPCAHVLCTAPTGAGKSLIFETLARKPGATTLLVSPLRALIRQQESRLESLGIRIDPRLQATKDSTPTAWVTTPEQLLFRSRQGFRPSTKTLMVVDECHCVEEWGPSFRTEFAELPGLPARWSLERSLWLSATLTREARATLQENLPNPVHQVGEFGLHPLLSFQKFRIPRAGRISFLLHWLQANPDPGIIFCSSRRSCEEVGRLLHSISPSQRTAAYHAGLTREERLTIEALAQSNTLHWLSATSAFGMGMNYPHFSWVLLWEPPYTVLSLAQMLGRCGRTLDSRPRGALLWDEPELERTSQAGELLDFIRSELRPQDWLKRHFGS